MGQKINVLIVFGPGMRKPRTGYSQSAAPPKVVTTTKKVVLIITITFFQKNVITQNKVTTFYPILSLYKVQITTFSRYFNTFSLYLRTDLS